MENEVKRRETKAYGTMRVEGPRFTGARRLCTCKEEGREKLGSAAPQRAQTTENQRHRANTPSRPHRARRARHSSQPQIRHGHVQAEAPLPARLGPRGDAPTHANDRFFIGDGAEREEGGPGLVLGLNHPITLCPLSSPGPVLIARHVFVPSVRGVHNEGRRGSRRWRSRDSIVLAAQCGGSLR